MSTNSAKQSTNGKEKQQPEAKWTVMVYFAADNDLEEEAIDDLKEMKKVGSSDKVNIVAQLDSRGRGKTFRFLIGDEQTTLDEDVVGDPLPEINTGDPRELTKFIVWGADTYKAENYMLVLWGHGRGWEDLDNADRAAAPTTDAVIYKKEPAEQAGNGEAGQLDDYDSIALTRQKEIRIFQKDGTVRQNAGKTLESQYEIDEKCRGAIWRRLQSQNKLAQQDNGAYQIGSSEQGLSKRTESESSIGFLTDQTPGKESEISQDVLKMNELKFALQEAIKCSESLNGHKIKILGLDACLMGMAEVGYQIMGQADYLVASEDAIPDEGWPYERILRRLVKDEDGDMLPKDFAVMITREFLLHHREQNKDVTKSVCDLSKSGVLAKAIGALAHELMEKLSNDGVGAAVLASRAMAQSFYIKEYVDLYDFCSYLSQLCSDKVIKKSCEHLMDVIRLKEPDANDPQTTQQSSSMNEHFVLAYGFIGHRLRGANGVSIYFPCVIPSPKYTELPFAEQTKWGEFLTALAGLVSEQEHFSLDILDLPGGRVKSGAGTTQKVEGGTPQKMPKPLPRRKPKYPATSPEEPITVKTAARRKKEVAKK
ncbi:MAG: clostripain-related cysteine peptidase [Acidobacteria bacterium]|nr:clostripain-related cysteine peptidase [Acidobacteriota bacterium]